MNIYCVKLSTGDEIIGKVIEDLGVEDALVMENIFSIGLQRTGPTEVSIGMMPYLVGNPGARVNLNFAHIMTTYEPAEELKAKYIRETTGIQIARA